MSSDSEYEQKPLKSPKKRSSTSQDSPSPKKRQAVGNSIPASSPIITKAVIDKLLASYSSQHRKEIGEKYGVKPASLQTQWNMTTLARVKKALYAEFKLSDDMKEQE